jgi:retron-type reverse transcriptase
VSPIFKSGAKTDPSNYRPISVIPVVAKIFEKIFFDQLYEYLKTNKLLSPCQSGFRSMHSTLTALIEATNSWSVNIDNRLVNGVVFIDLKKAFDTIDHDIMLLKLENYGVERNSLTWSISSIELKNVWSMVNCQTPSQ